MIMTDANLVLSVVQLPNALVSV